MDYFYYEYNTQSFNEIANNILLNDFDGLLFAPMFYEESVSFLTKFKEKEIPIVLIDSNIPEIDSITYIGQDSYQSGYLGGKLISFGLKSQSNVLIITITRYTESTSRTNVYLQRMKGFFAYFEENKQLPDINFTEVSINYDTENHLTTEMFKGIDCVFIPNSRAHVVAKFIKENNIKGIRVIGYELLKQNLEYLNNDVIDFLIHQKPEEQGYLGISHLYKKIVLKENVDELYHIPLEIIVKENYIPKNI